MSRRNKKEEKQKKREREGVCTIWIADRFRRRSLDGKNHVCSAAHLSHVHRVWLKEQEEQEKGKKDKVTRRK